MKELLNNMEDAQKSLMELRDKELINLGVTPKSIAAQKLCAIEEHASRLGKINHALVYLNHSFNIIKILDTLGVHEKEQ